MLRIKRATIQLVNKTKLEAGLNPALCRNGDALLMNSSQNLYRSDEPDPALFRLAPSRASGRFRVPKLHPPIPSDGFCNDANGGNTTIDRISAAARAAGSGIGASTRAGCADGRVCVVVGAYLWECAAFACSA